MDKYKPAGYSKTRHLAIKKKYYRAFVVCGVYKHELKRHFSTAKGAVVYAQDVANRLNRMYGLKRDTFYEYV